MNNTNKKITEDRRNNFESLLIEAGLTILFGLLVVLTFWHIFRN